jgi:LCP family protein required for cell wall assembly
VPSKKIDREPPTGQKQIYMVKKNRRGNWLWIWFGLTGVAMLSATAGALLALSLSATPLRQTPLTPQEEAVFNKNKTISYKNLKLPELTRPVNILVLGTKVLTSDLEEQPKEDLGYHALVNSFDGLSDTMLLLRFDPIKDKLTVLSIPRDTRVYIEGHGETKINNANAFGGPALSAKVISEMLGDVTIDRYVRVNVQGVEKLIDALGGVNVYVPQDMKYQDDSQHLYINLKEGQQHLNGEKAVQFLRFRYDRYGDIGRVQRQQMLMRQLVEQTLQPSTLMQVPEIISIVQSHIDTNLSVEELLALTGFAAKTERSKVQMLMLPGYFSGDGKQEVSYWLPSTNRIKNLAAEYFEPAKVEEGQQQEVGTKEARNPAYLSVAIQDGTKEKNPEAVQKMISYLREAGYRNVYISMDEWHEPLEVTRIVAQQGDTESASALRQSLGMGEVRVESTGNLASDLTIQIGEDWEQKQVTSNEQ